MRPPPPGKSWLDLFAALPKPERERMLRTLANQINAPKYKLKRPQMLQMAMELIQTDWRWLRRLEQIPPEGDWQTWFVLTGRAWGKTRCAAEWLIEKHKESARLSGIIGRTEGDVKRYCLGPPSGVLEVAPKDFKPRMGDRMLKWPGAGQAPYATGETLLFASKHPDSIRGPNLELAWCDELAAWFRAQECWDNLRYTMRKGTNPQTVVTTTPKPIALIRDLVALAAKEPERVHLTRGTLLDNRANLAPSFVESILSDYEGTRVGQAEIYGEVVMQAEGALWQWDWFEDRNFRLEEPPCALRRVVVAVDPAAMSAEKNDETGIMKAGAGEDGRGYLLRDMSGRFTPSIWARKAILAYFGRDDGMPANRIVAERNNGGEMVENTIRAEAREMKRRGEIPTEHIPVTIVWASHGKAARAEPISLLYERGRISHCGQFSQLEYEMTGWEPNSGQRSPSRLDAMVWAFKDLMGGVGRPAEWKPEQVMMVGTLAAANSGPFEAEAGGYPL